MKGWKTWTAIGLYVACEAVKVALPEYAHIATETQMMVCGPLGVVGIAHKVEKGAK